ncbi:hypothetical protein [Desulfotignum phosphitoxidans]|uniref:Uncharacterized protein n=1 Tax=Desulfotignum phosphitoxidans DSM 13687 TaxID=1286635 RepID=S0G635_9BACT|nr:hypothetical protein [Desulfotignum phosphitoxidans]EMS81449.1 hypothetical protein Dpo_1c05900 [Desulfotignum phosphitoxidans DSM 13687]
MKYDNLLYLDIDFLSEKYEEETGVAPSTVISKNEGMDAQAGVSFLKSKLHSQVTKQYTASNQVMLKATRKSLEQYPKSTHSLEVGMVPGNYWVEGELSIGQWGENKNSKTALNQFYEIKSGEITYSLLPQNEYFLANLQALEIISPALQRHINIPVTMLCKVLYPLPDIKTIVSTPYIIQTKGYGDRE